MVSRLNIIGLLALLALAWLSLGLGDTEVPTLRGLLDWIAGVSSAPGIIVGEIRLPRTLLALTVGAAMGMAGAALQGLLRNPLVDPSLIGVSQGAALGAAAVFYFNLFAGLGLLATPLAGMLGAALTLFVLAGLSGSMARPAIIIMAGLAISTLTSALLAVILNFAPSPYAMQELVFWLLGSVSNRGMDYWLLLLPPFVLGAGMVFSQRRLLFGLSLGDQVAESMGLNVARGSLWVILGCALLVGAAVSVAGNIGFVGLLVPHLIRPLVNYRPDRLLLPSAIARAAVVCAADSLLRLMPAQRELKLGVLTALVGAPFFIYLVYKERQRWI